jgi:adenylate kinase family enzyme
MSTISIRLYDIFRKNLKLQEAEAKELVEVIQDVMEEKQAVKHEHTEQMVQKDIKLLSEHIDLKFGHMTKEFEYMRDYMNTKFATKEELANLKADMSKTIYVVSLGQLIAIIASVISLVLILKK